MKIKIKATAIAIKEMANNVIDDILKSNNLKPSNKFKIKKNKIGYLRSFIVFK